MKPFALVILSCLLLSFVLLPDKSIRAKIFVIDENSDVVEGAKVTLYKSHENYKKEKDWAAKGTTNAKGFIQFKDLNNMVYYIHVKKGDLNNNQGDNQTDTLTSENKNRFEIMID